ncbi:MAG TPA: hypothetical protein VG456_01840 [Candidatus Sulfopaludibacter sp.]|jgi:hypothetical protein|nr:hypothetical protein [Candidatus Sulfopaludibacter sp.]
MKLTRRELASVLTPAALAAAQTVQPAGPVDELKSAQARLKTAADALSRHELPMDTEPAFQFKA